MDAEFLERRWLKVRLQTLHAKLQEQIAERGLSPAEVRYRRLMRQIADAKQRRR